MLFSQGFKPESLLFAAFFATLPVYSPNLVMFHDLLSGADAFMTPFVNAMMAVSVAAGLAAALITVKRGGGAFVRLPLVVAGAVCYVGGYALFAATLGVEGFGSDALAVAAGALVALGTVELCIAWGAYLAMFDLRQALFSLALMVGMASVVGLLLSAVAVEVGLLVFGLLLALGVALPCWKAARGTLFEAAGPATASDAELERFADDASTMGRLASNVRRMAQVLAMPFVGLLVFGFIMGVRKFLVFDLVYIETLGGIAAAAAVLPLCLVKMERPRLSFIYQVFLPVFALALVVLNAFPVGSWPQWLAATASYMFYGVIGILALASLCAMAHAREFSPALIYGLTVAGFALASAFGIFCGTLPLFAEETGGPVLLVVSTFYFAFLLAMPLVAAWRREGTEAFGRGEAVGAADVQQRCDRAARAGGLSPRETEVLSYLGRGHGIAFVAKTLVVSESTVRTHVKSIYKKLGVSSREELLQLIDEE